MIAAPRSIEGAGPLLGIIAKSIHAARPKRSNSQPKAAAGAQRMRFELQRAAQSLLYVRDAPHANQHRTCWCHRRIKDRDETLTVYRSVDGGRSRIQGIGTCGNVWTCPVCSSKVCEVRRDELATAMIVAQSLGHHAYLLTLTSPHRAEDALDPLLDRQKKALQSFRNSRGFKAIAARYSRLGAIHASECTWGINGWHPHAHDLWLAAPGLEGDFSTLRRLKGLWLRAQLKAGLLRLDGTLKPLRDAWRHGLDLRGGQYAAEYIAKFGHDSAWGLSSEVTRPHAKVGLRREAGDGQHFTPFALLEWAMGGDSTARAAFQEYARAYSGRRMLVWSRGLKAALGIAEINDELAAEREMGEEVKVGILHADAYAVVMKARALGEFMEYASQSCIDPDTSQRDLDDFIDYLRARLRDRAPPGRPDLVSPRGALWSYPGSVQ